ncbi:MAG: MarR family transcriptional regulator [Nitrosopumilaceae archaeon]
MGGAKKQSPAQAEKKQSTEAAKKSGTKSKKGKKDDKGEEKSVKAEIRVILTDEQAMKAIKGAKVITVQELARLTGVKISTANVYLKKSLENGTVKRVGGHSGHHVYQPISA